MAKTITGYIRTIALWVMILTAVSADTLLYLNQQWIWASFWSIVILLVIGYELYAIITEKKTISTIYKEWIQKGKVAAFWARLILILLWVGLNCLILHLWFW